MQRAFVIRGFGTKKDSAGNAVDFELVHSTLIEPALKRCDMAGGTTAQEVDAGNISADMFALILEADIVICDITVHNANVFYELGVRHALRKKRKCVRRKTRCWRFATRLSGRVSLKTALWCCSPSATGNLHLSLAKA